MLRVLCALFVVLLLQTEYITAFSIRTDGVVQVARVQSQDEWYALADARYDEWINDGITSRMAFRLATVDIYQEERPDATLFLAKQNNTVVGAAELSPHELQNAILEDFKVFYVTDVVTNRNHRRQGVAATLMEALESYAVQQHGAKYVVLHVVPDNTAALSFYQKLGYAEPSTHVLSLLNVDMLAENAGTQGQLLLSKAIC